MYQGFKVTRSYWRWLTKLRKAAYIAALDLAMRVPIGKGGRLSGIFLVSRL